MTKNEMLKIVNGMIAILILILAISAFSIRFLNLPSVLIINFTYLHTLIGYAFFGLILSHLYLNFNWIKANYLSKKNKIK